MKFILLAGQRTDVLNLRYKEWVSSKVVKEGIPLFLNQGFSLFRIGVKPDFLGVFKNLKPAYLS